MVPRGELIFVDARTGKQLPLEAPEPTSLNEPSQVTAVAASVENQLRAGKDVSLASVLSEVIR